MQTQFSHTDVSVALQYV